MVTALDDDNGGGGGGGRGKETTCRRNFTHSHTYISSGTPSSCRLLSSHHTARYTARTRRHRGRRGLHHLLSYTVCSITLRFDHHAEHKPPIV